jgi:histidyl-tRNA synthetase
MHRLKNLEQQKEKPEFQESWVYKGQMEKAVETARYYGFHLIEPLSINKRLPIGLTKAKKDSLKDRDFSDFPRDYMSTLKKYIDEEMHKLAQPIMLCHMVDKSPNWTELRLEIIGTKKSAAEAAVIKTASAILGDLGYKNLLVKLNCIGDRESSNNFLRELTNYYRGHISNLSPTLQAQLKKDILKVYANRNEKYKEINENAPRPIGFLSEESRGHFKQIIEFLENLEIDYEIDDELINCSSCLPKTLYEIKEVRADEDDTILAQGARHNYLAQNIGFNKKIPIVGMGINIEKKEKKKDSYTQKVPPTMPKIYFIHLGFEAKKRSLGILDIFRRSKVPVYQSLCNDSFANQLERAEGIGVPYMIIMGQKEVLEGSVIFRDIETRYQENVSLSELGNFLLRLRRKKMV